VTNRPAVVVTGMGAICALGDQPARIHDALCEGRSRFAAPTVFPADIAPGYHVAEVPDFKAEVYVKTGNVRPLDRTGRLALVGVELTLADCCWTVERRASHALGLILGTMFCSVRTIGEFDRRAQQAGPEYASPMDFSNTVLNAAAGQVAIWQKLRGINTTLSSGATSGVHAIGYAVQMIRAGRADALLAGGAEEICYESFHGSRQAARLAAPNGVGGPRPFDAARTGTAMGEGAAFLTLEAEEFAAERGARVLARVAGFAAAYDPTCHADCLGSDPRQLPQGVLSRTRDNRATGLAAVVQRALKDAGIAASDVAFVVSSASGSAGLDAREAAAIAAAVGSRVPVTAIKAMTGEALGASGALQVLTALETMRTGRLPGVAGLQHLDPSLAIDASPHTREVRASHALVTAIGPEGNCCALVLSTD
jgi:3-oxoacyl-[acyl-carrier-protein] synthase II